MGGEIVPVSAKPAAKSTALAIVGPSTILPQDLPLEERLKAAEELEAKLRFIHETIPTKVYNVMSSTAGAGSGDFHMYRGVRRQEQERMKKMDDDYKKQCEVQQFESKQKELQEQADARTARKRAKRLKKKKAGSKKSRQEGAAQPGQGAGGEGGSGSDSEPANDLD